MLNEEVWRCGEEVAGKLPATIFIRYGMVACFSVHNRYLPFFTACKQLCCNSTPYPLIPTLGAVIAIHVSSRRIF